MPWKLCLHIERGQASTAVGASMATSEAQVASGTTDTPDATCWPLLCQDEKPEVRVELHKDQSSGPHTQNIPIKGPDLSAAAAGINDHSFGGQWMTSHFLLLTKTHEAWCLSQDGAAGALSTVLL